MRHFRWKRSPQANLYNIGEQMMDVLQGQAKLE
jgi:hypothetical protein